MVLVICKNTMKLTFAQWLRLRRDLVDVTQSDLAKQLGVRPQTISNWENGVSIPTLNPDQMNRLCSMLKVELKELAKGFNGDQEIL